MIEKESLNERIYADEPIIAGVKARPYTLSTKLKLARIVRWLENDNPDEVKEELLFGFLFLIAAPIATVSLATLNRKEYLIAKDVFLASLDADDLKKGIQWIEQVTELEKETEISIESKPGSSSKETAPPN